MLFYDYIKNIHVVLDETLAPEQNESYHQMIYKTIFSCIIENNFERLAQKNLNIYRKPEDYCDFSIFLMQYIHEQLAYACAATCGKKLI